MIHPDGQTAFLLAEWHRREGEGEMRKEGEEGEEERGGGRSPDSSAMFFCPSVGLLRISILFILLPPDHHSVLVVFPGSSSGMNKELSKLGIRL